MYILNCYSTDEELKITKDDKDIISKASKYVDYFNNKKENSNFN